MEVIRTDRLCLRVFQPEDVDALAPICGDPEVMRYYPQPWTREDVRQLIRRNMTRQEQRGHSMWAVISQASRHLIGMCGLYQQTIESAEEIEVGYIFGSQWWGQGYATEAARASRDFGFAHLKVKRLISLINPLNQPSIRVAERNGMRLERELVLFGQATLLYSVDRPQAPAVTAP